MNEKNEETENIFNQAAKDLEVAQILNLFRLQMESFELAIKKHNPKIYDEYVHIFNEKIKTDGTYLEIIEKLKEAKAISQLVTSRKLGSDPTLGIS